MVCDTAGYKQARYGEVANEMKSMLVKVGWKKDFFEKKKSYNMGWWKGMDVAVGKETRWFTCS